MSWDFIKKGQVIGQLPIQLRELGGRGENGFRLGGLREGRRWGQRGARAEGGGGGKEIGKRRGMAIQNRSRQETWVTKAEGEK